MSIFDWFKPKWKHSDPKIRLAAVKAITDQQVLAEVARKDADSYVRQAAEKRIDDRQKTAPSSTFATQLNEPQGARYGRANEDIEWYFAEDSAKHLSQVVIEIKNPKWVKSRFVELRLEKKYRSLFTNTWFADFFRLNTDKGPFLMIRADGFEEAIRGRNLRIGFAFYKMPESGIIALYVEPDPVIVDGPLSYIESMLGIDIDHFVQRVDDAFNRDCLELVLTGEGTVTTVYDSGGGHVNPSAKYDLKVPLDHECKELLKREWRKLLEYHSDVVSRRKNNSASVQDNCVKNAVDRIWSIMPSDKSPILHKAEIPPKQAPEAVVEKITDQRALAEVALKHVDADIRQEATKMITDQQVLAEVAREDDDKDVRETAAKKATDQIRLSSIGLHVHNWDSEGNCSVCDMPELDLFLKYAGIVTITKYGRPVIIEKVGTNKWSETYNDGSQSFVVLANCPKCHKNQSCISRTYSDGDVRISCFSCDYYSF